MVLTATMASRELTTQSRAIVADLQLAPNLGEILNEKIRGEAGRLVTFFGMIPNFEPEMILPKLADLVQANNLLLFGANLAPGSSYRRGVEQIRPLYDNELTCDWLMSFLSDLGVEPKDGRLQWVIEGERYLRLAAYFQFVRPRLVSIDKEEFRFGPGDRMRLFFSYRYTPVLIAELLTRFGLSVEQQWITQSEEEGVFLCSRA